MRKCEISDLPRILDFYQLVIRETSDMPRYGRWIYGQHPTEGMIEDYVRKGVMYCSEEGQDITVAVAVTSYQTEDYHGIDWQAELTDDEVAVVHILAVNPHFQKCGYARKAMKEVIELAREKGLKAVRLDALECNAPAHGSARAFEH